MAKLVQQMQIVQAIVPVDLAITGIVDEVDRLADDRPPTAAWHNAAGEG